eukprot:TRINITY_DN2407_c0_g3_i1.p1 TRINITY_DN2407_c0_g3~~TRINITY_DN2407_c0_g3_i1.p1  ORF type:complete len:823 (+),score=287.44 TRINITY_DN2407_c0_g3_i1:55-2469(+)
MSSMSAEGDLLVLLSDLRQSMVEMGPEQGLPQRVAALRALLQDEGFLSQSAAGQGLTSPERLRSMAGSVRGNPMLQRGKSMKFHVNRKQRFHDEINIEARQWVHFHKLCKHGHWHGAAHPAHKCRQCVSGCGGGAWAREVAHDKDHHLVAKEKQRIRCLMQTAVQHAVENEHRRKPYADFKHAGATEEQVEQIVYCVDTKTFRVRRTAMQMEKEEFARGAMRACWRMMRHRADGGHDACVAKQYFNEDQTSKLPARSLMKYYVDTKMQCVAKHYAKMFSAHPECSNTIDFVEAYMIRRAHDLVAAPHADPSLKQLYCVEHYLSGTYVKHNNNAGYTLTSRSTPQAFSHYTYAKSEGRLMVVDIQGVGDLYTDPQIHTSCGTDFGDGNLGVTGFALYFQTHVCNFQCKAMKLKPFEVFPDFSLEAAKAVSKKSRTGGGAAGATSIAKLAEDMGLGVTPGGTAEEVAFSELRADAVIPTSLLLNGGAGHAEFDEALEEQDQHATTEAPFRPNSEQHVDPVRRSSSGGMGWSQLLNYATNNGGSGLTASSKSAPDDRITNPPESDDEDGDVCPPCGKAADEDGEHGGRGDVHLRLSELHAQGRFTHDVPHIPAAFYHLQMAALYGSVEGLLGLARLYSGLDRDTLLPQLVEVPEKKDLTIILLQQAFERHGSHEAAVALAALLGDGNYIPRSMPPGSAGEPQVVLQIKALEALCGFAPNMKKLQRTNKDRGEKDFGWGNFDATGSALMALLAGRYESIGAYQDAADTYGEAAELATGEGKGKLAAKLYIKAEEASALAEDDDIAGSA